MTKKYIFTEWLPNSRYLADDRIVGDFEYHDERSLSKRPSIDLYVPVKEKPDDVADKFHHNGNDERQHG
jgi:predicted transcriptional regulator YdeE